MTPSDLRNLYSAYQSVYNENLMESFTTVETFKKIVYKFIPYCLEVLKLKTIPEIHFVGSKSNSFKLLNTPGINVVDNSNFSFKYHTFGRTSSKNRIVVEIQNRHPMDALRTLAHELAHYKQHIMGIQGSGDTGSPTEDDASIKASVIMRNFGDKNSKYFKLSNLQ
jgi:hypothetical protein